eukprot:snap_masked-scaffold_45-processed-gene-1.22-mRNA-1 protein AED:1.00 eAED:1.00 QI:0/-1/0/0/-1/1/1/0/231
MIYSIQTKEPAEKKPIRVTYLQNIKIKKLTSLDYESIVEFLHSYRPMFKNNPSDSISAHFSRKVRYALKNRGVNSDSTSEVVRHLTRYKKSVEQKKKKNALSRMAKKLEWKKKGEPLDQFNNFFDQVNEYLMHIPAEDKKKNKKHIAKLILNALPKKMHLNSSSMLGDPKLQDLNYLKKKVKKICKIMEEQLLQSSSSDDENEEDTSEKLSTEDSELSPSPIKKKKIKDKE